METTRDAIYSRVTNAIIKAIEAGVPRCRLPWHITDADCFAPINAVSKRPYRGVNVLVLWAAALAKQYHGGLWATYRQWQELGAQVRKGEQATTVVLWKPTERAIETSDAETDEPRCRRGLLARGFSVFNVAQVDGYEVPDRPKLSEGARIDAVEQVLFAFGAEIKHGGAMAYYNITTDTIMPSFDSFREVVGYYATLAHEMTHWTGAKGRLDRDLSTRFGSAAHAIEELIAEFGAAFLCARFSLSVEPRTDHADYIGDWLAVLKSDKKALFTAASKAQHAVDWLLDRFSERLTS